ncbi:MAG: zinc ribbon domain-containing protein [Planctomycetota bacterium]|nr:zinc ribbon domain-containing protein [Planctomycetota bacterium]
MQAVLAEQRVHGGPHFPLLKGLLRCKACGSGMTYTYTRKAGKLYGYYACASARVNGNASCPMPSLPAGELERMAVDEVAVICRSPTLSNRVLREAKADHRSAVQEAKERHRDAQQLATKAGKAAERSPADKAAAALWQQAQAQLAQAELALEEFQLINPDRADARELLQAFEPIWAELGPRECQQLLRHLVDHITIDGEEGTAAFTFKAEGIAELARLSAEAQP